MLLRLLLITKNYQNLGQDSIKSPFFTRSAKKASAEGQSSPKELEEGPRSGPHVLVCLKRQKKAVFMVSKGPRSWPACRKHYIRIMHRFSVLLYFRQEQCWWQCLSTPSHPFSVSLEKDLDSLGWGLAGVGGGAGAQVQHLVHAHLGCSVQCVMCNVQCAMGSAVKYSAVQCSAVQCSAV